MEWGTGGTQFHVDGFLIEVEAYAEGQFVATTYPKGFALPTASPPTRAPSPAPPRSQPGEGGRILGGPTGPTPAPSGLQAVVDQLWAIETKTYASVSFTHTVVDDVCCCCCRSSHCTTATWPLSSRPKSTITTTIPRLPGIRSFGEWGSLHFVDSSHPSSPTSSPRPLTRA